MAVITQVDAICAFLFGLALGSFLNVVAYRWPRGESIVHPGSHCPSCERSLGPWELIPVLSWLFLFGRCRSCHRSISIQYPLFELLTAVLFALSVYTLPSWPLRLTWMLFWWLLMTMVATDLSSMRVPNLLSLPGFFLCFAFSVISGNTTWWASLVGAGCGFGVILLIHLLSGGKMGLGDAKLFLCIGAMLGPVSTLEVLMLASFSGALIGFALRLVRLLARRQLMPFVPHIAVGVIVVVFYGHPLTHWYVHQVLGLTLSSK